MNRILRELEVLKHNIGIAGLAGVAILFMALVFGASVVFALHTNTQQQEVDLKQLKAQQSLPQVVKAPILTEPQQLEKFYGQFPITSDLPSILETIHQIAADTGVVLSVGEYKWLKESDHQVVRYELVFPVEAQYQALRHFIEQVGVAYPSLGLSEISIKRETIDQGTAQVKLSYVLYMVRAH